MAKRRAPGNFTFGVYVLLLRQHFIYRLEPFYLEGVQTFFVYLPCTSFSTACFLVAGERGPPYEPLLLRLVVKNTTADGARSLFYPTTLSRQLPSALVMWLTESSGEFSSSPTVMAVSGSHEDGVNTAATISWFHDVASCWTVAAVIPDIRSIPQPAVLPTMADRGVDLSALPKEVRDQLAELDLELSEGKLWGFNSRSYGGNGCKRS